jgi:hypothetical protein
MRGEGVREKKVNKRKDKTKQNKAKIDAEYDCLCKRSRYSSNDIILDVTLGVIFF